MLKTNAFRHTALLTWMIAPLFDCWFILSGVKSKIKTKQEVGVAVRGYKLAQKSFASPGKKCYS